MRARRFVTAVSVTAVGVMVSGIGVGGEAWAIRQPAVRGAGTVILPPAFGDFAGDPVSLQVHAAGSGTAAAGRFSVVHRDDAGGLYARAHGEITCMTVADGVAVTTGVIRHAWFRDFPGSSVEGSAVAITVADDGPRDVIGFDFEFFGSTIVPCGAVPPFLVVERGNFTVE